MQEILQNFLLEVKIHLFLMPNCLIRQVMSCSANSLKLHPTWQ